ncbi:MAG: hypothetical protein QOJ65_2012, partial [Fimbriimonadaceae bacterium]|nr:hypothetical protein [Fimbriimonadaceae bacterium]
MLYELSPTAIDLDVHQLLAPYYLVPSVMPSGRIPNVFTNRLPSPSVLNRK